MKFEHYIYAKKAEQFNNLIKKNSQTKTQYRGQVALSKSALELISCNIYTETSHPN